MYNGQQRESEKETASSQDKENKTEIKKTHSDKCERDIAI